MQGAEGLQERLLRLEREAALQEGQGECRPHREDQGDPPQKSRETYGYLRVHAELRALGERCNRKRVARLMRKDGLRGCMLGRRRKHTTRQDPLAVPALDLVERDFFRATAPDRQWTADITYVPTDEGFLYLAFILDVYSRKVVGWSMATQLCAASWWRLLSRWRSEEGIPPRGSSTTAIEERSTRLSRSARGWSSVGSCRL